MVRFGYRNDWRIYVLVTESAHFRRELSAESRFFDSVFWHYRLDSTRGRVIVGRQAVQVTVGSFLRKGGFFRYR